MKDLLKEKSDGKTWIPWHGGLCPLDWDTKVEVRFSDGKSCTHRAGQLYWGDAKECRDRLKREIIAYCVLELGENSLTKVGGLVNDMTENLRTTKSDGSTASYYELPEGSSELQHLISDRNMNAQIGEIFRACYRYGLVEHSECLRDAKKIKFYAEAEIARLEKLEGDG